MTRQAFAHLHNHTEYSMLDGLARIPWYVQKAKKDGATHLGITDHGNVMGWPAFYLECKKEGINPVLGEEFYFVEDAAALKEEKKAGNRFHVVFLANDSKGVEIMTELSSEAHRNYYYKPVLDRGVLEGLSAYDRSHITVLSGCAGSIISQKAMNEGVDEAAEEVQWWRMFQNFYMELQHHHTDFDKVLNNRLVEVSRRLDLPWVITNDPHYAEKDQCSSHDALLAIQTGSDIDDPSRFRFEGRGYHLRSPREMQRVFARYGDDIWLPGAKNTIRIAESCTVSVPAWESRSWHIPKYPKAKNSYARLKRLTYKGLEERGLAGNDAYVSRAEHELKEFAKVGMADFLLITMDLIQEANRRGFRTGPGRGSVCGTLVGYLIGIHKIDSVKYDLLFERFLNPERPKMPDIDSDLPTFARDEMFGYTQETFGPDNVMHVAAYQTMKAKRAFQALARAHGIPFQDRLKFSEILGEDEEGNLLVPEEISTGYPDLTASMDKIVGLKSSVQAHPAGLLIFSPNDPIRKLVPEQWIPTSKKMVSQYDLRTAELLGLMKQDILGLRNIDTIMLCLKFIKERHGIDLEPDDWIPDEEKNDAAVYRMLAKGKTAGVFQMEGGTNHRGIQEIKPTCFEDIVACTSLYRAGPMIAGSPARYLKNRSEGRVRVAHPSLKPILRNTWGELIYQEQMFEILHKLAGFSWSRVDDAKSAMTRKDAEKMESLRVEAIEGFQKVAKMPEDKAEEVWATIAAQASYLFNRSHAVAYSMLTYQTARLKWEYPLEYLAACVATVSSDKAGEEKRYTYLSECSERGFKILRPDVLKSDAKMKPEGNVSVRFGLVDIKGIGDTTAKKVLDKRETLRDPEDVVIAVGNVKAFNALMNSGALESLGAKANAEMDEELLRWQFNDPLANFRTKWGKRMRRPRTDGAYCRVVGEIRKVETKKTKAGRPYVIWKIQWVPGEEWGITLWEDASDLWHLQKGSVVAVEGKWSEQWRNISIGDSQYVRVLHAVRAAKRSA